MFCYTCGMPVTTNEHIVVQQDWFHLEELAWINLLAENPIATFPHYELLYDILGLLHCDGPDNLFDSQGHTITCRDCFEKGKRAAELS